MNPEEIDPFYFERPYYVIPDGEAAEEGYRVIRDALKLSKKGEFDHSLYLEQKTSLHYSGW